MRRHLTAALLTGVCALALAPASAADQGADRGVALTAGQGVVRVDAEKKPPLAFSAEQRQAVIDAVVQRDTHQPTPQGFEAAEGAKIPPTLDIHALPPALVEQLPTLKEYMYAHINRNIVIIDAAEKKVAMLIPLPEQLVQDQKKSDPIQAAAKTVGGLAGLSDAQRHAIYQAATAAPQAAPEGAALLANAPMPAGINGQPLPAEVAAQSPELQGLSYAKLQDGRLLLIDSKAGKIAGIITQDEGSKVVQDGAKSDNSTGTNGSSPDPLREREESGKDSAYTGPTTTGPNTDPK
jgi:hypothetical protein